MTNPLNSRGASALQGAASEIGSDVVEQSISELATAMAAGSLTSEMIVKAYIKRIRAIDNSGLCLNSVIEVNPDAESFARALDHERRTAGARGPLHGVPILLKDNVGTNDRTATAAGSLALAASAPAYDSSVASRLRAAGAILLGKANMSEWANFRTSRSTSGWSGRGGQCRNPYVLDRSPGGSSSGSGVAAAASLCAAAIGTETDGSIVYPASVNGVVGFKPTVGLVSRAGILPISQSQDTAGPMTRTVEDAVLLLEAIQGTDPNDPATSNIPIGGTVTSDQVLQRDGLRGARLGVVRNLMTSNPEVNLQFEGLVGVLKAEGAEIIDGLELCGLEELRQDEWKVLLYEFKDGLNAYLSKLRAEGQPRTLEEVIDFNLENAGATMPLFGQETLLAAQAKGPLSSVDYVESLQRCRRLSRQEGIDALLTENGLDALVCPTTGPAVLIDHVHGDSKGQSIPSARPAAVAGYPHVTVPAGMARGLPWGLSIFSTAWRDTQVLRYGYVFEQATSARTTPKLLWTAESYGRPSAV